MSDYTEYLLTQAKYISKSKPARQENKKYPSESYNSLNWLD